MTNALIKDYLKRLRLPTISKNYLELASDAEKNKASFEDYLCCLLELEVHGRDARNKKQRLSDAKFPVLKTLDTFQFEEIPNLDKNLVLKLFKGQYLSKFENIVFIGGQGTGKTHLSIALGIEACNNNKKVKYFSTADLIHQLLEARDEKQLLKIQEQLLKLDLLILDELGLHDATRAYSEDGSRLLFQVISSRYERASTIITTNLEFDEWNGVFGSQKLTAALLDRVTHRCHIVNANGESYRFKESMRRKKKGQDNT
jgi:DNA replication protein DnaC